MSVNSKIENFFDDLISQFGGAALPKILALRHTRNQKQDGSYVTEGDLAVQRLVSQSIHKHFKDVRLVSEEDAEHDDQVGSGVCIVVDPIDGTENFTSGLPEWGVSIACYQAGVHVGSLIGMPEMNYWIRSGRSFERFTSRIHGLSSSLTKEQILSAADGYEYRILGCCVYNMINVIRGSFAAFENPKGANSWDILAGVNLALENGLLVEVEGKKYAGQYLRQLKSIASKSKTDNILVVGKGPSVDRINWANVPTGIIVNLNDSERIHAGEIGVFSANWVRHSLNEGGFRCGYYLAGKPLLMKCHTTCYHRTD